MKVTVNEKYLKGFIKESDLTPLHSLLETAHDKIMSMNGEGSDFLGWRDSIIKQDIEKYNRIKAAADKIKRNSDVLIVIGIGGSYLGARAIIELLKSPLYNSMKKNTPDIYFAGNSLSSDELNDILKICEGRDVAVNVISKSGTTTEPAVAFRIIRKMMEAKYSKAELIDRIFITTDKARGTLKKFADNEGYETFIVPDDIGGRFSVLIAVGLLPIAVSGIDIDKLIAGAASAREQYFKDGLKNTAYRYALLRTALYRKNKKIELLCSYRPSFRYMAEWWKQLFGESEGKQGNGIFPASVVFTTDLHSMGQYIQDGERTIFETVVMQKNSVNPISIPFDAENIDGLNFVSDMPLDNVNNFAFLGTIMAHTDGGVPNIVIEYDNCDEETVGELIYFFFLSCAASAYMLGVNPFDQPGVEAYKKNMFALMGKSGYEKLGEELKNKITEL
ncbi:MAG: glucose-6-phosphate isomerase [Clostridiales bacterium GWF2_38_85]|nr:MAG: glucose-6-phosphate isomerase [Clostridiales bacterium GWF2_38_85]HBL85310.1 glucose-6-phosphate isomerase [Clostridiales bacterium]